MTRKKVPRLVTHRPNALVLEGTRERCEERRLARVAKHECRLGECKAVELRVGLELRVEEDGDAPEEVDRNVGHDPAASVSS